MPSERARGAHASGSVDGPAVDQLEVALSEPKNAVKVAIHDVVVNPDEFGNGSVFMPLPLADLPTSSGRVSVLVGDRSVQYLLNALSVRRSNFLERLRDCISTRDDAVARNEPASVGTPRAFKFNDVGSKDGVAIAADQIVDVRVDAHGSTVALVRIVVIRRIAEDNVEPFVAIGASVGHDIAGFPAVLGRVGERMKRSAAIDTGHSEFGVHRYRVRSP